MSGHQESQVSLFEDATPSLDDEAFRPELYAVRPISFAVARKLIEWGHYTHSLTKGRYAYGLIREGEVVGAAVFGQPSGRGVARSIWAGGDEHNTLELLRLFVVDGTGKNAETWFLARAIRQLPSEVKVLVAYSAPGAGHHGGCYQAGNWMYVGRTNTGQSYYYTDENGRYVNKRIPWQYGPRRGIRVPEAEAATLLGLDRHKEPQKHAYLYLRDKRVRKLLRREVQPYPKPDCNCS